MGALAAGLLLGRAGDGPARVSQPSTVPTLAPSVSAREAALDPAQAGFRLVVELADPALLDPTVRDATLARVAVPSAIPVLRGRFAAAADDPAAGALAAAIAAGGLARVVPAGATVVSVDGVGATVEVWVVAVTAAPGLPSAVQSWSTETLTLRAAPSGTGGVGGWLLAGYASRPGPAPASTQDPSDPATVVAAAGAPVGAGHAQP